MESCEEDRGNWEVIFDEVSCHARFALCGMILNQPCKALADRMVFELLDDVFLRINFDEPNLAALVVFEDFQRILLQQLG